MKRLKVGLIAATLAIGTTAPITPAQAMDKDGETGYALGCLIAWHVFGLWNSCLELQN